MQRRIFAMAAGIAAVALLGAHPASASQCTQSCDKTYQDCSAGTTDSTKCLPKWGQCKKACTGSVATKAAHAPAVVATAAKNMSPTPKAKVTKVAATSKTKAAAPH